MAEPPIRIEMIRWKEGGMLSLNKFGHGIIRENSLRFKQIPTPPIELGSTIVGLIAALFAGQLLYLPLFIVGGIFGGRRLERIVARYLDQTPSSHTQQTAIITPGDVIGTKYHSKFALFSPRGVLTIMTVDDQIRIYGLRSDLQELATRLHTRTFVDDVRYCPSCGEQTEYSNTSCSACGEPIHAW